MQLITEHQGRRLKRAEYTEYGAELARRYLAHSELYNQHYRDAQSYRRAFVSQCWPRVSPLLKRYIREGFTAELTR